MSETIKDEAAFEDKMVDTMVLEDPQNMVQALEKLVDQSLYIIFLISFNKALIVEKTPTREIHF